MDSSANGKQKLIKRQIRWKTRRKWNPKMVEFSVSTFASWLTAGFAGNSTTVAFNMVCCSKMAACDRLWPNGCSITKSMTHQETRLRDASSWDNKITARWKQTKGLTTETNLSTIKTLKQYNTNWPDINLDGKKFEQKRKRSWNWYILQGQVLRT